MDEKKEKYRQKEIDRHQKKLEKLNAKNNKELEDSQRIEQEQIRTQFELDETKARLQAEQSNQRIRESEEKAIFLHKKGILDAQIANIGENDERTSVLCINCQTARMGSPGFSPMLIRMYKKADGSHYCYYCKMIIPDYNLDIRDYNTK